jgi:hypothetical protein
MADTRVTRGSNRVNKVAVEYNLKTLFAARDFEFAADTHDNRTTTRSAEVVNPRMRRTGGPTINSVSSLNFNIYI